MNPDRRQLVYVALFLAVLVFAVAWSYRNLAHSKQQAIYASQDLQESRTLAYQIHKLSFSPALSSDNKIDTGQIAQRVESAARHAAMPVESIIRLDPESPQRIGQTPYQDNPTSIYLHAVSMTQLLQFLAHLEKPGKDHKTGDLKTRSIRISSPREAPGDGKWNVDLTVSYITYHPQS